MTIENSPRAISTVPARTRPRGPTPARPAAIHPVATLAIDVTMASARAGRATSTRSDGSIWNEKKTKNVAANRSLSGAIKAVGALLGAAGQGEADEKGADRPRHLDPLRQPADQEREPEHGQQQRFVRAAGDDVAEVAAVSHGEDEDHGDGRDRQRHAPQQGSQRSAGDQRRDDRQIDRHREVLDHEHVEHRRRLAEAEPAEVREHLGDDPGRAHPADPTEQHRGERCPAEQQAEDDAGHGVEHHVGDARDEPGAQPGTEFRLVVLETECEQEEQHSDLGGEGDEILTDVERDNATLADDEAGDEVERDGGDPDAPSKSRQDRQRQHDGADLDERERRLRRPGGQHDQRPGGGPRIERNVARPSSVPTATTTSCGSNTKSGSGAGTVVSPRMTATTDAPVRVRSSSSAIV